MKKKMIIVMMEIWQWQLSFVISKMVGLVVLGTLNSQASMVETAEVIVEVVIGGVVMMEVVEIVEVMKEAKETMKSSSFFTICAKVLIARSKLHRD